MKTILALLVMAAAASGASRCVLLESFTWDG